MTDGNAIPCWICGEAADTHEHRTKRSDLKLLFHPPSQKTPLYFHTDDIRNRYIGSLNAKRLKWQQPICGYCNSARTQPHDEAWSALLDGLISWPAPLRVGTIVRTNRIFRYQTSEMMLRTHLYFVKQTGCMFADAGRIEDTKACAAAIMRGKAHPNLHLKFSVADKSVADMASGSNLRVEQTVDGNKLRFAAWIYHVGPVEVMVMVSGGGEKRDGLMGAWHPRQGTNRLIFAEF